MLGHSRSLAPGAICFPRFEQPESCSLWLMQLGGWMSIQGVAGEGNKASNLNQNCRKGVNWKKALMITSRKTRWNHDCTCWARNINAFSDPSDGKAVCKGEKKFHNFFLIGYICGKIQFYVISWQTPEGLTICSVSSSSARTPLMRSSWRRPELTETADPKVAEIHEKNQRRGKKSPPP